LLLAARPQLFPAVTVTNVLALLWTRSAPSRHLKNRRFAGDGQRADALG